MRMITFRLAASALVIGLTTVGCQSDDSRPFALSDKAPKAKRDAFGLQQQAQAALREGKLQSALALMEEAVALSPRDAGYRMSLAELYMRSGRFASAERTFSDAIILNPENVQASLYLGLSRAAQGKTLAAVAALEAAEGRAKAADLGLAYALAGEGGRAVTLLESAAREEGANARVRQNLALAYALSGDWAKARVTAAQDISPAELDRRLQQWATLAQPNTGGVQVAAFFGVTPAEDAGQPLRLALAAPEEKTMLASVEAVEAPVAAPVEAFIAAPVALATAADYAIPAAPASAEAPKAVLAAAPAPIRTVAPVPAVAFMPTPAPLRSLPGNYVVQIGAFGSRSQADAAWKGAARRYGFTADRQLITTFNAPGGKGLFHRLAIRGYATPGEAGGACRAIKAKGGDCFVRAVEGGGAPARIAARR